MKNLVVITLIALMFSGAAYSDNLEVATMYDKSGQRIGGYNDDSIQKLVKPAQEVIVFHIDEFDDMKMSELTQYVKKTNDFVAIRSFARSREIALEFIKKIANANGRKYIVIQNEGVFYDSKIPYIWISTVTHTKLPWLKPI